MNRSAQDQRVKTGLDETRLLILGAQILFGFHLNGAFQSGFSELSPFSRGLHAASFFTMAIAIALLITPSLQHQLIDGGRATTRILGATTAFAAAALLPIALSLGADLYIVIGHRFGAGTGATVGIGFALTAFAGWYGAEWLIRTAAVPLAGGIVGDLYVAVTKALSRQAIGAAVAVAAIAVLATLWFVHPLLLRARRSG